MSLETRPRLRPEYVRCLLLALWAGSGGFVAAAHGEEVAHELGRIQTERLRDTSGLAVSRQNPGVLWLHNDGGNEDLYAVRTDGQPAARLNVRTSIDDLEDIAIGLGPLPGTDFIYLGDIGDNNASRREVRVVRFPEPSLSPIDRGNEELRLDVKDPEEFLLRYPDGPHEAEALLIDAAIGELVIVTKERRRARLYRVALDDLQPRGVTTLELAAVVNVGEITAGDISRTGDWVILRGEDRGWLWARQPGEDVGGALLRAPSRVLVRGDGQGKNGKAIGFSLDGHGYFTVSGGKRAPVFYFPIIVVDPDASL
jgi:hypothetical protein